VKVFAQLVTYWTLQLHVNSKSKQNFCTGLESQIMANITEGIRNKVIIVTGASSG
jgi:hypothetical protein